VTGRRHSGKVVQRERYRTNHDATESADCRCRNVVESRAMRGGLVVLWQRTARLLERMRAQAAAAAERGDA
jgi:hypothetical protein